MQLKLSTQKDSVIVEVHVVPRAKKTSVLGVHDGRVKLALCAPPVDGEANRALIAFFAELLQRQKRDVVLLRGEKSRQKTLAIAGTTVEQVAAALGLDTG